MSRRIPVAAVVCALSAVISAAVPALDHPAQAVISQEAQTRMTPSEALERLKEGNARHVAGKPQRRDLRKETVESAKGQYPFAVVIGCVDSRSPAELVFDQGLGDLFHVRLAGNVVDEDGLGSAEFATKVAGAKLVVVLGHTACGAVKGSMEQVEMGNLTSLLSRIRPAVEQVAPGAGAGSSKDAGLVDKVAEANVRQGLREIREKSPVLRELVDSGKVGLVGGMLDLSSGRVTFLAD